MGSSIAAHSCLPLCCPVPYALLARRMPNVVLLRSNDNLLRRILTAAVPPLVLVAWQGLVVPRWVINVRADLAAKA